jgi:hypothetical protein
MSKFNLKDKDSNEMIELPDNFTVEHETEKGILIKNSINDDAEWMPLSHVKVSGDIISVAKWLYDKSDLFN